MQLAKNECASPHCKTRLATNSPVSSTEPTPVLNCSTNMSLGSRQRCQKSGGFTLMISKMAVERGHCYTHPPHGKR